MIRPLHHSSTFRGLLPAAAILAAAMPRFSFEREQCCIFALISVSSTASLFTVAAPDSHAHAWKSPCSSSPTHAGRPRLERSGCDHLARPMQHPQRLPATCTARPEAAMAGGFGSALLASSSSGIGHLPSFEQRNAVQRHASPAALRDSSAPSGACDVRPFNYFLMDFFHNSQARS
jgi:hypothetical protein